MKKVAIIIERANIALGGAERSVFEVVTALAAHDCQVKVLAATGQTQAKNIHLLCNAHPTGRTSFRTFKKALRKHFSENHYDIIHSVLPFDFVDVYQPRGGSYAESMIRNTVSYPCCISRSYKKLTAFANFRRMTLLRAERKLAQNQAGPAIAALSQYVADQFKQHYTTNKNRIKVIPNGVRINKMIDAPGADKLRGQILGKLKLKEADEPTFFLFAANNFRLKGLAPLMQAMHLANSPDAYLIVAGHGKSLKYRRLAKKLGVQNKIVFLGAVRNIQNALAISNVAVLPSFYDPSSRFILEALVAAKPVITTRFNGAIDLFTNNRHGKIVDSSRDIAGLAKAISYFTDKDNIKKTSQNIVTDNLKEKISIQRVARELVSLYNTL